MCEQTKSGRRCWYLHLLLCLLIIFSNECVCCGHNYRLDSSVVSHNSFGPNTKTTVIFLLSIPSAKLCQDTVNICLVIVYFSCIIWQAKTWQLQAWQQRGFSQFIWAKHKDCCAFLTVNTIGKNLPRHGKHMFSHCLFFMHNLTS